MMTINSGDLRRIDLNLLPVFMALIRERNLTKAAQGLHLGQPAVSAALKRLRETFKDKLLVRTPKGMAPTERAIALARDLEPLLSGIVRAVNQVQKFDPSSEDRVFKIGMPDNHEFFLMPKLMKRLCVEAPGVRIVVRTVPWRAASKALDDGDIDIACGRIGDVPAWQCRDDLMKVGFLCLFDGKRLGINSPISLSRFLALPHLLFSSKGDLEGVVDDALAKIGKQRRIVYATSLFSVMPAMLKEIDAIVTLPKYTAEHFAKDSGLTTSRAPVVLPTYKTSLAWLSQKQNDPAHMWLRTIVKEVVASL